MEPPDLPYEPSPATVPPSSLIQTFMKLLKIGAAQKLNGSIDEEEVLEAMKKLNWNKAVGVDDMQADLIIAGKVFLDEPLALFNNVFHTKYPKSWTVGLITPILRKANPWTAATTEELQLG
jgi:hypothetical protein